MYLETLKKQIENLDRKQHIDLFRIIKERNITYSENNNGIFFNLSHIKDTDQIELQKYIKYVSDQEESLSKFESVKEDYKSSFFENTTLNKVKEKKSIETDKNEHYETTSMAFPH